MRSGTTHETLDNDMTVQQVADFFGVAKTTISEYTNPTIKGNPNEYRKELEEAGFASYNKEEIEKLTDTETPNQSNNVEFTWPARTSKINLFTLRSVTKLGMFMTKTDSNARKPF